MLLFLHLQQLTADQRAVLQIKLFPRLLRRDLLQPLLPIRLTRQILSVQRKPARSLLDPLIRLSLMLHKTRAQHLVSLHDPVQRTHQRTLIQLTDQPPPKPNVIRAAGARLQLRDEPQPLLG